MNLFFAIAAGFVMAAVFQLVLTNLSVAVGLNLLSPVTSPERKSQKSGTPASPSRAALKISAGFGAWTLLSCTAALFAASYLAASVFKDTYRPGLGVVIGLTVWALFYLFIMSLEIGMATSLAGALSGLVRSGFRSASEIGSIFSPSDEKKTARAAAEAAKAVKEEFFGTTDTHKIQEQLKDIFSPQEKRPARQPLQDAYSLKDRLEKFLSSKNGPVNPEDLEKDLKNFLADPRGGADSLKEKLSNIDPASIEDLISEKAGLSKDQAHGIVNRITGYFEKTKEKAAGSAASVAGKVRETLSAAGKPELEYEAIAADLKDFTSDPKGKFEALVGRLKAIDRPALQGMLAAQGVPREKTDEMVNRFESVKTDLLQKAEAVKAEAEARLEEAKAAAQQRADDVRKIAAVAAWWLFATTVTSGAASAFGGWLALL